MKHFTQMMLIAVVLGLSAHASRAEDIFLTCRIKNLRGELHTEKVEISDGRIVMNGTEITRNITVTADTIVFNTKFELSGKVIAAYTTTISRVSGRYEEQSLPDHQVTWSGSCDKAEPPVRKF